MSNNLVDVYDLETGDGIASYRGVPPEVGTGFSCLVDGKRAAYGTVDHVWLTVSVTLGQVIPTHEVYIRLDAS